MNNFALVLNSLTLNQNRMRKNFLLLATLFFIGIATARPSFATTVITPSDNAVIVPGNPDPAKVNAAKEGFKNLSKKEKRMRFNEVKAAIKHYKAEKKTGSEPSTNTLLLVILAILLPPLAVYLHEGVINNKFWLDLILTLLFWLPGLVYALIVVLSN